MSVHRAGGANLTLDGLDDVEGFTTSEPNTTYGFWRKAVGLPFIPKNVSSSVALASASGLFFNGANELSIELDGAVSGLSLSTDGIKTTNVALAADSGLFFNGANELSIDLDGTGTSSGLSLSTAGVRTSKAVGSMYMLNNLTTTSPVAQSAPVKVVGVMTTNTALNSQFSMTTNGTLQYIPFTGSPAVFTITLDVTCLKDGGTVQQDYLLQLFLNGASLFRFLVSGETSSPSSGSATFLVELSALDEIEVHIANTQSNNNVIVRNMYVTAVQV